MEKKYSWQIINGFWLKLVAFILMTVDHVGVFLANYQGSTTTSEVLRIIGRLAFPLFIFLLVEGVIHTRSYAKYALRLGIIAIATMITQIVIYYCFDSSISSAYSPLLDLLACSCVIYLLKRKDKYTWFIILPLIWIFGSFAIDSYEMMNNITIHWFPFYLRCGYSIYGLLLSLCFYYSHALAKLFLNSSDNTKAFIDTKVERNVINILSTFSIFLCWLVIFALTKINAGLDLYNASNTSYAIIGGAFIMLYSGERGYNKAWFKYGSYLYYPLHLVILAIIFYVIL